MKTAAPPPGYFVCESTGLTRPPRAAVRVVKGRPTSLIALEPLEPGDTVLVEAPLLAWMKQAPERSFAANPKSTPLAKVLAQRCAAVEKLSSTMKDAGKYCAEVLPILRAHMERWKLDGGDVETVWGLPWELSDTLASQKELQFKTGFCVLAMRGFSNTSFDTAFKDPAQAARLCVIAERGGVEYPVGDGRADTAVFKHISCAARLDFTKPKLVSAGARPRKRRETNGPPAPNADYYLAGQGEAAGTVVLRARSRIAYGEEVTIPRNKAGRDDFGKLLASAATPSPVQVLRDKTKLADAVLHRARVEDAPEIVRSYAASRHPKLPPALPPKGDLSRLRPRDVSKEVWVEHPFSQDSTFLSHADYILDQTEASEIARAWLRLSTPCPSSASVPFHVGFGEHAMSVSGDPLRPVATHLVSRAAAAGFFPRAWRGLPFSGVASEFRFFRFGPGEELLEFRLSPSLPEGQEALPVALMLSGGGKLCFENSRFEVDFKPGRVVMWSGLTHRVPFSQVDKDIAFAYLIFQKPTDKKPVEGN